METVHSTDLTETEFPLIEVQIYKLKKQLQDAEWNNDRELIIKLKNAINSYKLSMSLGEKYIVPF
jgi:hypothetical protein